MLHCSKTDQAKKIATTNQMAYLRNFKKRFPPYFSRSLPSSWSSHSFEALERAAREAE